MDSLVLGAEMRAAVIVPRIRMDFESTLRVSQHLDEFALASQRKIDLQLLRICHLSICLNLRL